MLDDEQKYEKQISNSKSKKFWSIVGGLLGTTAVYTGAFLLKGIAPGAFIPLLLAGTGIPIAAVQDYEVGKLEKKEAEDCLAHLEEIQENGVVKSDALDQARVVKAEQLKAQAEEEADKARRTRNIGITAGSIFWIGGIIAGLYFQPAFLASLAGLIGMGSATDTALEHDENAMKLATRFENIKNDLLLGSKYRRTATKPAVVEKDLKDAKAAPNPTYEKQIDAYVEGLGKGEIESNKVYQKLM